MNKAYVDSRDSNYLPLSGGEVNGTICANEYITTKSKGKSYTVFSSVYPDEKMFGGNGAYIGLGSAKHGYTYSDVIDLSVYYDETDADNYSGVYVQALSGSHKLTIAAVDRGERKNLVRSVNGKNAEEDGNVTLDVVTSDSLEKAIEAVQPPLLSYVWSDYDFSSTSNNWVVSNGKWLLSVNYPKAAAHLKSDISGKSIVSETIQSINSANKTYTIYYYMASDGHKLVPTTYNGISQWDVLNSMLNDNGSAWFYCYDPTNWNFALPRDNAIDRSFVPVKSVVPCYGNGMTLGLDGDRHAGLYNTVVGGFWASESSYGQSIGSNVGGALQNGNYTFGVTIDRTKSGIVTDINGAFSKGVCAYMRKLLFFCK